MALLKIGYFCTGGHTETGALDGFLKRLAPEVSWVRCFPPVLKPAPKLGRVRPEPHPEETGVTGDDLSARMVDRLRRFHPGGGGLDAVMLVDDADCRFHGDERRGLDAWVFEMTQAVRAATGVPDLPFIALLASPEIEAWFVADWARTFGSEPCLRPIERALRARVQELLAHAACDPEVEGYGCPPLTRGCTHKLSAQIQEEVALLATADLRPPPQYSKKLQGAAMLERLDPDALAERCRLYYRPAWRMIRGLGSTPSP